MKTDYYAQAFQYFSNILPFPSKFRILDFYLQSYRSYAILTIIIACNRSSVKP